MHTLMRRALIPILFLAWALAVHAPAQEVAPDAAEPPVTAEEYKEAFERNLPPPAEGDDAAPVVAVVPRSPKPATWSALGYLPRRFTWITDRYPWIAPQNAIQGFSVGLLCLAMFGLCIHLGTGAAGIEDRGIVSGVGMGALVLVAGAIQLACVAFNPLSFALMVVGNGALWILAGRALFGGRFFQMATVALTTAFFLVVGVLLLEAVDFVLQSDSSGLT